MDSDSTIDGRLFNIDTLKFFEVLIALEKGAVLQEFRGNTDRRLVWEIGAGWGGFPYQFKSLCPNVTYVISDFPELFLFSATYLMTAFPNARVAFWGEEPTDRLFDRWRDLDFIFLPNASLGELRPERLDLTINMVSFQEMTDAQVAAYVERAFALKCPFLYSLNRDKSAYNPEISSVSEIISRHYWPREISVLPVPYQKMMGDTPSANDYKHVIGWRRVKLPASARAVRRNAARHHRVPALQPREGLSRSDRVDPRADVRRFRAGARGRLFDRRHARDRARVCRRRRSRDLRGQRDAARAGRQRVQGFRGRAPDATPTPSTSPGRAITTSGIRGGCRRWSIRSIRIRTSC